MPKFELEVIHSFRTQRKITVTVEAEDRESAIENLESGSEDIPSFNDPRWKTGWDLQGEEVKAKAPMLEISAPVDVATLRFWTDPAAWAAMTETQRKEVVSSKFQNAEQRRSEDYVPDYDKPVIWLSLNEPSVNVNDILTYDPTA